MLVEVTQGARDLIEKELRGITEKMTLSPKDGADVEKELRSSFYEGSEAKARERGASAITEEDARKAISEEGTPQEIAAAYMSSYAGSLKRAGFWRRSAAYIVDMIIQVIAILIMASPFILITVWASRVRETPIILGTVILANLAIGIIALGLVLCYTIIFEGRWGQTPGKYLLGLKVIRTNGMPIGYKEALLRNIPKFVGNFIVIDALIMVIFFNKEKQRAFDKVADTIVVRTRG